MTLYHEQCEMEEWPAGSQQSSQEIYTNVVQLNKQAKEIQKVPNYHQKLVL